VDGNPVGHRLAPEGSRETAREQPGRRGDVRIGHDNQGVSEMLKNACIVLVALGTLSLTTGCATLADAQSARGTGAAREYPVSMERVWGAIPAVLSELQLPLVSQNRANGTVLAQRGITPFSYGENVAIFVESVDGAIRTRVEVISKKAMATNIFAPDWSTEILDRLGEKLR
jgi:hypothetical protein